MAKSSTAGNSVGPLPLPDTKNQAGYWHMTFKDKKVLLGDARILPKGRPEPDHDLVGTNAKRVPIVRKDTDIEPVAYHGIAEIVWQDLLHQVGSKGRLRGIMELTPLDTALAKTTLEWHIPYMCVCMNEFHKDALRRQLVVDVFKMMQPPKVHCIT